MVFFVRPRDFTEVSQPNQNPATYQEIVPLAAT